MWVFRGNATERGDDGGGPGQSSLFFLTIYHPEIGLSGARVQRSEEPSTSAGSGALSTSLENPREHGFDVVGSLGWLRVEVPEAS